MEPIVVENVLMGLFSQIPAYTYTASNGNEYTIPKPVYHYGDGKELNKLIKEKDALTYPLIYQTSTGETHTKEGVETDLVLVLANRNTETDLYNTTRWETSYKNVLMPLLANVKKCLEKTVNIDSNYDYSVDKFPNYSGQEPSKDKNAFIDIVDAIQLRVQIKIINGCINHNIFN